MSAAAGQQDRAVRMEKQQRQGGNDSRLSLGQCFSDEGRRSSARLRHQSLDRGMQRPSLAQRTTGAGHRLSTATSATVGWVEDSQAESPSLGQRTVGADDKLHTAARSVCPSIPVALSVHCRSDEPDRTLSSHWSCSHWVSGPLALIIDYLRLRRLQSVQWTTVGNYLRLRS